MPAKKKARSSKSKPIVGIDTEEEKKLFQEATKIVGVKGGTLAAQVVCAGVEAFEPISSKEDTCKIVLETIQDQQPKDGVEARLAIQAAALFAHGMKNLKRSAKAELLHHSESYVNRAIKLLKVHNETVEALSRYLRGGEQRVTVTHAIIAGQAVVNNNFGEGASPKNRGDTSCSSPSAERKQEPTTISHADSPQWLMGDVGSMAAKAPAPKQKRAKKGWH